MKFVPLPFVFFCIIVVDMSRQSLCIVQQLDMLGGVQKENEFWHLANRFLFPKHCTEQDQVRFSKTLQCDLVSGNILQLLYAGEGEARRPDDGSLSQLELSTLRDDKPGTIGLKGHEFVQISYHMPTNCEVCPKPLWHMFRPPPALECRRKFNAVVAVLMLVICRSTVMLSTKNFFLKPAYCVSGYSICYYVTVLCVY